MPPTDEELMQRVAQGNREAFEELVRRYYQPVLNYAIRFLDDPDVADDMVQETFLRLLQAASRWHRKAKFSTYLYHIVANLCRNELQRARRGREGPLEEREDGPIDPHPSPEEHVLKSHQAAEVRAAVRRLPLPQRQMVLLHHFHDLTHTEIAQVCRCPVGTVKSRLFHAHRKLREWLEEEPEE